MAGIGLRYPYYAKYKYNEGTGQAEYSEGGLVGKAVEFSAKVEAASDNILYADDGAAEVDSSFNGGTVSITTDDLTQAASEAILGLAASELKVGEQTVKELIFDESRQDQDLGFGVIIPKKKDGRLFFRAVVLTKIKFSVPEDSAKTKGEKIEWQTPKLEGTIMRDDTARHAWKRETTVDSEELAREYIKQLLNIREADAALSGLSLGSLTLTPAFDPAVTLYAAETANATNTITATARDSGATVDIDVGGTHVPSGTAATWAEGANTVTITVTSGGARKVYTVTVTKTAQAE